ncbi:hypothetical protein CDD82_718 [Ophiocordyceps australis]|uniref:Extracellular membrane protein CFEM domain-containing protein n=1 Tax=Ophiocordyceps australis TaxID=1399860 RepID=A0A2C5YMH6_9HYPO|nr:hypothetical protein CDD82_718 [Ophiocordyceps australis]
MKSAIFAAASAAAVASAHEARAPLDLGLDLGNLVSVDLCLGLDVMLPMGISIGSEGCPKAPPPQGCTNVWHPPHNVEMDDCDDNDQDDWHYVRPCNCQPTAPHSWTTSTVTATHVSTVISCKPEVTNCPGKSTIHTTVSVPATTTICPVPVGSQPATSAPGKATQTPSASLPGKPTATGAVPQPPVSKSSPLPTSSASSQTASPSTLSTVPQPPKSTPCMGAGCPTSAYPVSSGVPTSTPCSGAGCPPSQPSASSSSAPTGKQPSPSAPCSGAGCPLTIGYPLPSGSASSPVAPPMGTAPVGKPPGYPVPGNPSHPPSPAPVNPAPGNATSPVTTSPVVTLPAIGAAATHGRNVGFVVALGLVAAML